jgi:tetratricopeptide (TPR) repeat protein
MSQISFIIEIKRHFPESSWAWVISALQVDPLIWENLTEEGGYHLPIETIQKPVEFTPAAMALFALGFSDSPDSLRELPLEPVIIAEETPRDSSAETPEAQNPLTAAGQNLAQAGLAALQLREGRREAGSWDILSNELSAAEPTVLACLYGMVPDSLDMLRALAVNKSAGQRITLALHAILSNPMPPETQYENLRAFFEVLTELEQKELLKYLAVQAPTQAAGLAKIQLAKQVITADKYQSMGELDRLAISEQVAEIQHIAIQAAQEIPILVESLKSSRRIQARLSAKLARAAQQNRDMKTALAAWDQATHFDPNNGEYLGGLALALLEAGRPADARARIDAYLSNEDRLTHPLLLLGAARISESENSSSLARQALEAFEELAAREDFNLNNASYQYRDNIIDLAQLLLNLNLPGEATRAAQIPLQSQINDPEALSILAGSKLLNGEISASAEAAYLAAAFAPERIDLRRQLALVLEIAEEWQAAFEERAGLLARQNVHTPEDLKAYGTCALHAGQPEKTIQACQEAMQIQENDGPTLALLGEAEDAVGDHAKSYEHLELATQLSPHQASPWLSLAHHFTLIQQPEKTLECLRTGTQAAPDSPEVHLALGEAYLSESAPTQALAALRQAAQLESSKPYQMLVSGEINTAAKSSDFSLRGRISLRLGQTLHQLGHLDEARQVLGEAFQNLPENPEAAYSYAQILLSSGEFTLALPILKKVVATDPQTTGPYLDTARCILVLDKPAGAEPGSGSQPGHQPSSQAGEAIPWLKRALEIDPENAEVKALLAEALSAHNELLEAMQAYHQVLETELAQDPNWQARLSLGLGRVAMKLGQIETAVAAIQEANQADPLNADIQKTLSEAYDSAGLTENAFQAARAATLLAPNDLPTLTWFAWQALELRSRPGGNLPQAESEAIEALKRATELAPYRTDLLIRMGEIQLAIGDNESAHTTYCKVLDASSNTNESAYITADLHQAAQGLLRLGDATNAINCLELALQVNANPGQDPVSSENSPALLDLLVDLATARQNAGKYQAALKALDQAIILAPDETSLYLDKANLLLEMNQQGDALECLENVLALNPNDPELHRRTAIIQRASGDLQAAMAHAQNILDIQDQPAAKRLTDILRGRAMAGELARAMLQNEWAQEILGNWWVEGNHNSNTGDTAPLDYIARLDYHCLRAELALDTNDDRSAVESLAEIMDLDPTNPRVLSIQARLAAKRGDASGIQLLQEAQESFQNPSQQTGENSQPSTAEQLASWEFAIARNQLAIAEAAVDLQEWETALELFGQVTSGLPLEPQGFLSMARTLVRRAEFQRLCQDMEAIHHAPGAEALTDEAYQTFQDAIQTAEQLTSKLADNSSGYNPSLTKATIDRWRIRGQAAFQPDAESAIALGGLAKDPEDSAAQIACLRQIGDLVSIRNTTFPFHNHPLVLAQAAIAFSQIKPRQALATTHAAIDLFQHSDLLQKTQEAPTSGQNSKQGYEYKKYAPFLYYLLARLTFENKTLDDDFETALKAIRSALELWPNEPRWHMLAATIYKNYPDPLSNRAAIIDHLEKAVKLEPEFPSYYVELGKEYIHEGFIQKAIDTLEQATHLSPQQAEIWLILAQAYQASGNLELAASRAEQAVALAPRQSQPLLLRGEIALQANNPKGAQSRAEAALRISPDDPAGLLLLARALTSLNRTNEALSILEKALPLTEEPLPLSLERARLLRKTHGQELALQALKDLAERYPEEPSVLALMAEILEEAGQNSGAIQIAQRALHIGHEQLDPGMFVEHAHMHHLLGRLLSQTGQLDQAIHHLSEAIHLAPGMVEPYLELGRTHLERRQHVQALQIFQQAIEAVPGDPRPYYQAGMALKESKDYLAAEKMLRRAAEIAPNDLGIHRLLGAVIALNLVHNRQEVPVRV